MKKEELLRQLRDVSGNTSLRFPSDLGFESNDGILSISLHTKGLEGNMLNDYSAFEGWAIAIKAIVPELVKFVNIKWKGLGLEKGTKYNHYRRFLYRILRFEQSYDWVSSYPMDKQAECDLKVIASELTQWVVNYPESESKEEASKEEARLERLIKENLSKVYETSNHQLPVGLFYQKKLIKNERTPRQGSQIDLWSISNDTLSIYELKQDDNRKIGIISELMFYVNVMKDIVDHVFEFSEGAEKSNLRCFNILYNAIKSASIHQIDGVFLTNDLHPILRQQFAEVFKLLNNNTRSIKYKQMGFKISEIYDIVK